MLANFLGGCSLCSPEIRCSRDFNYPMVFHPPPRHSPSSLLPRPSAPPLPLHGGDVRSRRDFRRRLSLSAGYRRVPMENAGAYWLIDNDTGDKFIVWGASDDALKSTPPPSIPSEEVLRWTPQHQRRSGVEPLVIDNGRTRVESVDDAASSDRSDLAAAGFRKLNAFRINEMIKKRSSKKVSGIALPDSSGRNERKGLSAQSSRLIRAASMGSRAAIEPSLRGWDAGLISPRTSSSSKKGLLQRQSVTTSDTGFFSRMTFQDLGCNSEMIKCLTSLGFVRPSHIQALSYRPVLEGKSCIIVDQSGSGKTLAYIAPIVERLLQQELLGLVKSLSRNPRVIILVPTAELASQVLQNCRLISKSGLPFRSMVATGKFRQKTQIESLQEEMDVLIATPGRFSFLLQEGFIVLTNLQCVVLDEVDILFGDESFEVVLENLIRAAPVEVQYLFVTATLPLEIYNKLVQVFPDCEVTMGPGMHRTSRGLEEIVVDCSGNGEEKNTETAFENKISALLQLVEESPVRRTIVFCNKIETCRKVENALKRYDRKGSRIKTLAFHAALDQETRLSNIKEFVDPQGSSASSCLFLVCTDRASRGIDFSGGVDHVVLFDFPRDPSEYVRRVGRTARGAGGKGKAFILVVGKQLALARKITQRNIKGHPLHHVPSAPIFASIL